MFGRSRKEKVKRSAVNVSELALELARDRRFRKRLLSALEHGSAAQRRARSRRGLGEAVQRLVSDRALRGELRQARRDLQQAYSRLDAKRKHHRLRTLTILAGVASAGAAPVVRKRLRRDAGQTRLEDSADHENLEHLTKEELYARAQAAEIPGRSEMSKRELVAALRAQA